MYVYDPSPAVITVTIFVLQPNTNTICFPPIPTPFDTFRNLPETVNEVP